MAAWSPIKTKKEYRKAMDRIDALIDAKRTDAVRNELMLLSFLIEDYELRVLPLPDASPQEVILFTMKMKGLRQKDLIPIFGSKAQVSRILGATRQLRLEHVYPLSKLLGIPPEALIPTGTLKSQESV